MIPLTRYAKAWMGAFTLAFDREGQVTGYTPDAQLVRDRWKQLERYCYQMRQR